MPATILVADDDIPIANLVALILEDEGYVVLLSYNGRHALQQLELAACDLLITDNMMPGVTGLELVEHLHANPALAVPVIMMSAVRPLRAPPPPTVFLPKPFDLTELLDLVERLLKPD